MHLVRTAWLAFQEEKKERTTTAAGAVVQEGGGEERTVAGRGAVHTKHKRREREEKFRLQSCDFVQQRAMGLWGGVGLWPIGRPDSKGGRRRVFSPYCLNMQAPPADATNFPQTTTSKVWIFDEPIRLHTVSGPSFALSNYLPNIWLFNHCTSISLYSFAACSFLYVELAQPNAPTAVKQKQPASSRLQHPGCIWHAVIPEPQTLTEYSVCIRVNDSIMPDRFLLAKTVKAPGNPQSITPALKTRVY